MSQEAVEALLASVDGPNHVLEFLSLFAGVEHALKRTKRLRRGLHDRAEPDWWKFTDGSLRGRLASHGSKEVRDAFRALGRDGGPKEQFVTEAGDLDWRLVAPKDGDCDEWRMIKLVRTVRNNLFHGGKYGTAGLIGDPVRDLTLLKNCTTILRWCIEQDSLISDAIALWAHEAA